jgi:hypothetical protein
MTRRRTDGDRIADRVFSGRYQSRGEAYPSELAVEIDRLIRKRMAEAWEEGWFDKAAGTALDDNPYRGRKKK